MSASAASFSDTEPAHLPGFTSENPALDRAMRSVLEAMPRAEQDPMRPVYHFRPPANWMNDPNGTIWHEGWYHLFYQHNPYGDAWGHMHWGHARSRDLVHWEHLPIALWPSLELGEEHCFSGCAAVNGAGERLLFYTKVGPESWAQWVAVGDSEWRTWQKHAQNPILALGEQGAPQFGPDWRDPYIFTVGGRTFLVLGANRETGTSGVLATVALYEATDDTLLNWAYRGDLIARPQSEIGFYECPNFIPLGGDQWMLLTSPYTTVQYVVGHFDLATLVFSPQTEGTLDPGLTEGVPAHFYATNTAFAPSQNGAPARCILFGWIRGFLPDQGWNGVLALPRTLTLGADGRPRQQPVDELQQLRDAHTAHTTLILEDAQQVLEHAPGALEIDLTLAVEPGVRAGVALYGTGQETHFGEVAWDGHTLWVAGQPVAYPQAAEQGTVRLHMFLDRSTVELFVDDGRLVVTRVLAPIHPIEPAPPALFARGGAARFDRVDVWTVKSIW